MNCAIQKGFVESKNGYSANQEKGLMEKQDSRHLRIIPDTSNKHYGPEKIDSNSCDVTLVAHSLQNNQNAYRLLVLRYQNRLANVLACRISSKSDRQDIVQESFIRAFRGLHSFRNESSFYTWLYRIAINTAASHTTRLNKHRKHLSIDHYPVEDQISVCQTPEKAVDIAEIHTLLIQVLDKLPLELKTALLLKEKAGLKYEDIAATMNCPVGTVRSRIFRAREIIINKMNIYL